MALRNLKLLVSGGLDFTKGMDSIDKHVEQISFRQCSTFCEHGQLKGWHDYELLGSRRTANFGYRKFTAKNHSNPSLIHNSNFDPDDVRAGL